MIPSLDIWHRLFPELLIRALDSEVGRAPQGIIWKRMKHFLFSIIVPSAVKGPVHVPFGPEEMSDVLLRDVRLENNRSAVCKASSFLPASRSMNIVTQEPKIHDSRR